MISLPSFTFVPGWLYIPLFNWIILLLVCISIFKCYEGTVYSWNADKHTQNFGNFFVLFLILYIGLRPTILNAGYDDFVDTFNYKRSILVLQATGIESWLDANPFSEGEWLYACIESISAAYADEHLAFLVCAIAYVGCPALYCKREFGRNWFFPFLMICSAFTFFTYGVNGVRNGMAASMVILALSYREKIAIAAILCFLALGVHKSLLLLIVGALIATRIRNSKVYIFGWFISILAVSVIGRSLSQIIGNLGFLADERLAAYSAMDGAAGHYYTGFRLDFLAYSALPVIIGWHFIYKKNFYDKTYIWIYNIYIIANSFWVLMMYASYSNRFAQLSWFIMPIVCFYPWFKQKAPKLQQHILLYLIIVFYAYTFYTNIAITFLT